VTSNVLLGDRFVSSVTNHKFEVCFKKKIKDNRCRTAKCRGASIQNYLFCVIRAF
jgi:hypothetical protein